MAYLQNEHMLLAMTCTDRKGLAIIFITITLLLNAAQRSCLYPEMSCVEIILLAGPRSKRPREL